MRVSVPSQDAQDLMQSSKRYVLNINEIVEWVVRVAFDVPQLAPCVWEGGVRLV